MGVWEGRGRLGRGSGKRSGRGPGWGEGRSEEEFGAGVSGALGARKQPGFRALLCAPAFWSWFSYLFQAPRNEKSLCHLW